jgi:hypothetical protein
MIRSDNNTTNNDVEPSKNFNILINYSKINALVSL